MTAPSLPPELFHPLQRTRAAVAQRLPGGLDYLLAVSGGADSLALAAVCADLKSRGDLTGRLAVAIVDHQLQQGSTQAAEQAAASCRGMGLVPVVIETVTVGGKGSENDARQARYQALESIREQWDADFLLTAHTANDQAEQVLMALARGSGTRALAGIPGRRGRVLRPFLEVWREDVEAVCQAFELTPWEDPTNADPGMALRNRVRLEVLPHLTEVLGETVLTNLVRTATQARHDADHLDHEAEAALQAIALTENPEIEEGPRALGRAPMSWDLDRFLLKDAPMALRTRVLRLAAQAVGGRPPTSERTAALERLTEGTGSAGPIQLDGHVSVHRSKSQAGHSIIRFTGHPPLRAS